MKINRLIFKTHGADHGQLVAIEDNKDIPFHTKRIYYMYDTGTGMTRGFHAHKTLQQVLICIHGSCKIRLDDGKDKMIVSLDKPYEGLYIQNTIWRELFDFSPDAVLVVLASEFYNEDDYIRDYNEFLKYVMNLKCSGEA